MRMALRTQNQCRMTVETLANIKNSPVIYAKQANISQGHQQINNGTGQASQAEENQNLQNKLLVEAQNGGTAMDIKATGEPVPVNSEMEAMEQQHGAENGSG